MTDKTDIDNVRYSFETQEFFQRQIEEAIDKLRNLNKHIQLLVQITILQDQVHYQIK